MKIAILGWGSLIWDPRGLLREGVWEKPGPSLPLEFSRVSRDCRLTLVIDSNHGDDCETLYALSPRVDLDDAIQDLRGREGTSTSNIGFVDLERSRASKRNKVAVARIRSWGEESDFSGVVWTDLEPNFMEQTGMPFTLPNPVAYVEGLPKAAKELALKYIRNAPLDVSTPLRRQLFPAG